MAGKSTHGYVSGLVQGVGFRFFVQQHAEKAGVTGFARNLPDKRVEFVLQGDDDAVEEVLRHIHQGPRFSRVNDVEFDDVQRVTDYRSFTTN